MKKKSLLVLISVVVIFAMFLSGCGGNAPAENPAPAAPAADAAPVSAIQQIKNNGVIRIAVPEDTPLFGAVGTDGQLTGYDVEIANMVATEMGVKAELVPVSSANRIPYLTSGKVDLVIANMGIKPERAEVISFSNAYAPFLWAVYAPKDLNITTVEDAAAYKVGATLGTLEEIAYSDAAGKDATNIQRFDDQATTVQAFTTGQIDVIVASNAIAGGIIASHPEMNIESKIVLQQSPCHMGVRQSDEGLLNWVNAFIYVKTLNGTLDDLSNKWFGEPLPDFPNY